MDDLKVVCESEEEAREAHWVVQQKFLELGISLNEKKCGVFAHGIPIPQELQGIPEVTDRNPSKSLGVEMAEGVTTEQVVSRLMEEVDAKTSEIASLKLSGINTIHTINSCGKTTIHIHSNSVEIRET